MSNQEYAIPQTEYTEINRGEVNVPMEQPYVTPPTRVEDARAEVSRNYPNTLSLEQILQLQSMIFVGLRIAAARKYREDSEIIVSTDDLEKLQARG